MSATESGGRIKNLCKWRSRLSNRIGKGRHAEASFNSYLLVDLKQSQQHLQSE
ncbi:MAG: hypothetical protein JOZ78_12360 [Chroococcidiopsidaceae cyanobacterium CP_BM_ER_R8_30]|nr:hypothetical protein [Chroococcidiopsidaceae cyanobacterium CP_BM_ER_R8_30]